MTQAETSIAVGNGVVAAAWTIFIRIVLFALAINVLAFSAEVISKTLDCGDQFAGDSPQVLRCTSEAWATTKLHTIGDMFSETVNPKPNQNPTSKHPTASVLIPVVAFFSLYAMLLRLWIWILGQSFTQKVIAERERNRRA